jgi:GNAT superfamily N-acetyltransferase
MSEWVLLTVDGSDDAAVDSARELFREYHQWLGTVVCSRTLGHETAALPGVYAPPRGRLIVAFDGDGVAQGIVAVRPFSEEGGEAEVKRLYVRPTARGGGLGRVLAQAALDAADELGYDEVLLTTLPDSMATARAMYERMGFVESAPFYDHSHVAEGIEMLFMRRTMHRPR